MESALSDRLFQQFSHLVYQECGINLHEGKRSLLQARLNKRLRATGIGSYEAYYQLLTSSSGPGELIHFLDSVSTNLTYFFREVQHFDFFEKVVIPEWVERKKKEGSNRIRVWSAACSTGEEPYSLAMCVASQLSDLSKWDFRILATDISTRVLNAASTGVYPEEKVEKVPAAFRQLYFQRRTDPSGKKEYELSASIKKMVAFRRMNLNDQYPFRGPFDCVFCRNVMIYFDKKTQEELINRIAGYLGPGGYLFVGHSESLTGLNHGLKYVRPAIYRK